MVNFSIHESYVSSYVANRNSTGVMVAAQREDTKEAGWLYVCHAGRLNPTLCDKAKWIISCWLPSKYDTKSPFGGNSGNKVHTTTIEGTTTISVELVVVPPVMAVTQQPITPRPEGIVLMRELHDSNGVTAIVFSYPQYHSHYIEVVKDGVVILQNYPYSLGFWLEHVTEYNFQ